MKQNLLLAILTLFIFGERPCISKTEKDELDTGIHGLLWKAGPPQITRDLRLGTFQIHVGGYYERKGWKLFLGDYEIPVQEKGEFRVAVPVEFNNIRIEFIARGPKRAKENEFINIYLNDFIPPRELKREERLGKTTVWFEKQFRSLSLNFGLGTSYLEYEQTDWAPLTQTSITPKLDATYVFPQNEWSIEASIYCSLLALSKPSLAEGGLGVLGSDVRVGYEVPVISQSTALYLFGGFYYSTTFGTENIGYSGIWGPEVYPALRTTFRNGSSLSVYAKYSPILSDYFLLTLDNASLSGGAVYFLKPFKRGVLKGVPLGFSADITRLSLKIEGGSLTVTTYTLAANLLF